MICSSDSDELFLPEKLAKKLKKAKEEKKYIPTSPVFKRFVKSANVVNSESTVKCDFLEKNISSKKTKDCEKVVLENKHEEMNKIFSIYSSSDGDSESDFLPKKIKRPPEKMQKVDFEKDVGTRDVRRDVIPVNSKSTVKCDFLEKNISSKKTKDCEEAVLENKHEEMNKIFSIYSSSDGDSESDFLPKKIKRPPEKMQKKPTEKKIYACVVCGVSFVNRQNLNRHMKIHNCPNEKRKWECIKCGIKFYKCSTLQVHDIQVHQIPDPVTHLQFQNYSDFLLWKEKEESTTFSYFSVANSEKKNNETVYERFACQLHGTPRKPSDHEPKLKKSWRRGSVKRGLYCPARIIVTSCNRESNVRVSYSKTHSHPSCIENLKFQPLTRSVKEEATKLLQVGVRVPDVYDQLTRKRIDLNKVENGEQQLSKEVCFKKKAIVNLNQKLKMNNRKSKDEETSFNILLKQYEQLVLMFEDEDSFILGYQSSEQRKVLEEARDHMLFIDSTHGTFVKKNKEEEGVKYNLFTIMVSYQGHGYPVAFFLMSSLNEDSYFRCLSAFKERNPEFKPEIIMSDDDVAQFNAVNRVYEEAKKILCLWHVEKNWIKNVHRHMKMEDPSEILQDLKELMYLKDEKKFLEKLSSLDLKLSKIPKLKDYFEKYYLSENRIMRWAVCKRQFSHCDANTNMFIESYHGLIKNRFFKRQPCRRLDDYFNILLDIDNYYRFKKVSRFLECEKEVEDLEHKASLKIPISHIMEIPNTGDKKVYSIKSTDSNLTHEIYIVSQVKEFCDNDHCFYVCKSSLCRNKGVQLCSHLYVCTCRYDNRLICKHIHRVHMFRINSGQPTRIGYNTKMEKQKF